MPRVFISTDGAFCCHGLFSFFLKCKTIRSHDQIWFQSCCNQKCNIDLVVNITVRCNIPKLTPVCVCVCECVVVQCVCVCVCHCVCVNVSKNCKNLTITVLTLTFFKILFLNFTFQAIVWDDGLTGPFGLIAEYSLLKVSAYYY